MKFDRKHYKPNVVYVALINRVWLYIGCVTFDKPYIWRSDIIKHSGNPLSKAYQLKLITYKEYQENFEILNIEDFDSKKEALEREVTLINKYKEKYSDILINKCLFGNAHSTKGLKMSEEQKRKLSERSKGRKLSQEARKKISDANKGKPKSEEQKRKISNTLKGRTFSEEVLLKRKEYMNEVKTSYHMFVNNGQWNGTWNEFQKAYRGLNYGSQTIM